MGPIDAFVKACTNVHIRQGETQASVSGNLVVRREQLVTVFNSTCIFRLPSSIPEKPSEVALAAATSSPIITRHKSWDMTHRVEVASFDLVT